MYMEEIVSNDLKENLKVFWSYVKSKRQESTGVSPLKNKNGFIHSDMHSSSKVEILNDQFVSAYHRSQSKKQGKDQESIQSSTTPDSGYQWESDNVTIHPKKGTSDHPTMDSILLHRNGVLKLLRDPKIHIATCPGEFPAFILKSAAKHQSRRDYNYIVPAFKKGEKHLPSRIPDVYCLYGARTQRS